MAEGISYSSTRRPQGRFATFARRTAKGLLLALALLAGSEPASAKIEPEASREYYEKAQSYVAQDKLRAAVIELKNALQRNPQNGEARLLLGQVYVRLGDGSAAEKELRVARRHGISADRTVVVLARALLLQGQFEALLAETDTAAANSAFEPEVGLLRAEALAGLGRPAEARQGYDAIVQSHPDDSRAYVGLARLALQERHFEDAEAQAKAALARNPGLGEALLVLAEARRLRGDVEPSLDLYRQAIDSETRSAIKLRAQLGLASGLIALRRDGEAEETLEAVDPSVPLGAYLRALIKMREKDFKSARRILDEAAPRLENFVPAQFLFGIVYFAADELEIARNWLIRHLRAQPANLQARKILAAALLRLNAVPDVIEALEPALAQAPDDPQVLMLLGNAYLRSGRSQEASELLQRAAEVAPQDPRVLSQLAVSHLATGEYDESLAALNASLDLDADATTLGYALAFMHLRSGAFDEALKIAQELRARFPDSAVAANLEGGAYAALGQVAQARESFETVLRIEPQFHQARTNLAVLKVRDGDIEGAEAEYRSVLENDPGYAQALLGMAGVARQRQDKAATRTWLEKAVAANPEMPQPSFALADDHLAAGETAAALEVLTDLAGHQPDNPQVLARLGSVQERAGEPDAAVATYRRLLEVSGSADARLLLARAELAAGDAAAARRDLEAALEARPDHLPTVEALFRLVSQAEGPQETLAYAERLRQRYPGTSWGAKVVGDLHRAAGRTEEALAAYEEGWAERPTAALAIALFHGRYAQGEGEAALRPLQDWLTKHPGDDPVRLALAEGLLGQGKLAEARATYEELKQTQGSNPVVWNNLAWLYQQSGDDRAVAHGEKALELAPDQPAIMDTLGWILLDDGQVARAADLLRQASAAAPDNPDIAYHYAAALHRKGEAVAAKEVLQAVLESDKAFANKAEAETLFRELSR